MDIKKDDIIYALPEFYNDPYAFVTAIQVYDDLDTAFYDGVDFASIFKGLAFEVAWINEDMGIVCGRAVILGHERDINFFDYEVEIDKNVRALNDAKRKNERQEKAGQMRLPLED